MAQETKTHYHAAFETFDQLVATISSADWTNQSFGNIEAMIQKEGKEVLRQLTQGHLNQRSAEENKQKSVQGDEDQERTYRRINNLRQIESCFGGVEVQRISYQGGSLNKIFPLDAALNLAPDKYSHGLRSEIAHLIASQSFDETLESLERAGGGILAKRQLQEVTASMVIDFENYYRLPLPPSSNEEERILVITADGKGISVHNEDLREATKKQAQADQRKKKRRLQPGEKKGRKRMSTVVSVYEIAPYHRTPEQLLIQKEENPPPRPKPENKRTWAGITEDMGTLIDQGFQEAIRRDPKQILRWVVLIDGQIELIRQVEEKAKLHNVEVTITQDFLHVTEYLWKASHALHPESAEQREKWVSERSLEILRGNAQHVASGLRRAASLYHLSDKERAPVDTAANYIQNSSERLRYDISLKNGFPIASGVIEGACRHLVKDRMDLTGARWRLVSAEAVLKLRSLKISGHLNDYLSFHFQREKKRNYPWAANDDVCASAA
ncbi:ISKra4 family transposase [Myxococcota bacterium]|nr:ISKra4 family transposase [Myxococcota bacterium]